MNLFAVGLITILLVFIYILQNNKMVNQLENFKATNKPLSDLKKSLSLTNLPIGNLGNYNKYIRSR
jgi:hypothetical protein